MNPTLPDGSGSRRLSDFASRQERGRPVNSRDPHDLLPNRSLPPSAAPSASSPWVEGYQVTGKLGCGGMGSVWRAVQLSTKREVALKVLAAGVFGSGKERLRFEREVELMSRLEHPHIARVYDSGVHKGICFYAMELIDGLPLDQFVLETRPGRHRLLSLMRTVCDAVQHAHLHGVIHRDLKPSNILVDPRGNPHVLDFGLAKTLLLNDLSVSVDGEVAGTPAYMSPEQARGQTGGVDVRTDVYSLGVILYRLLTGRTPHDLAGPPLEVLRRIAEEAPDAPRLGKRRGDRELEAILLKALAHSPDGRYASAGEFARDIDRFLNAEPVTARHPSFKYLALTWLRRQWFSVSVAAITGSLIVGSGIYAYVRVSHERNQAVAERIRADEQSRDAAKSAVKAAAEEELARLQSVRAERTLARSFKAHGDALAEAGQWVEAKRLYRQSRDSFVRLGESPREADVGLLQAYAVSPPPLNQFVGHTDYISCTAISPDGRTAVTGSFDHTLKLWDVRTGRELRTLSGHLREVNCVAFSPDGMLVLSGGKDDAARLWDVSSGRQIRQFPHSYEVFAVAFSADGSLCATSTWDGCANVWDTNDGRLVASYSNQNRGAIKALCFANDRGGQGSQHVIMGENRILDELTVPTGQARRLQSPNRESKLCVAASPDGKWLLVGQSRNAPDNEQTLVVVSAVTGETVRTLVGHGAAVRTVSFLPDSYHALSASEDGTIKRWDVTTGKLERTYWGDEQALQCVAFSPDGRFAISGGDGNVARLWDLEWDTGPLLIRGRPWVVTAMAASADGNTLLTGNLSDGVHLWDVATGSELGRLSSDRGPSINCGVEKVAMTPDGKQALVASTNGRIAVYDLQRMMEEPLLCTHPSVRSLAVSPDGNRVVVADGGNVDVWDLARRERIFTTKSPSTLIGGAGFSADGRTIVGCSSHGEAMYWDAASGLRIPGLDLLPRRRELLYDSSAAYTRDLSAMFGDELLRQPNHVLRLRAKQADGLYQVTHTTFAKCRHFFGRVGKCKQRRRRLVDAGIGRLG